MSRVEEAEELSRLFNLQEYQAVSLSGKNTQEERIQAINKLELENSPEKLDYIFSVDIFN